MTPVDSNKSWEEIMGGEQLCKRVDGVPVDKEKIYETMRGDFTDIEIELWRYTCPVCKKEKFSLTINDYTVFGGASCRMHKGKTDYSCGCNMFEMD